MRGWRGVAGAVALVAAIWLVGRGAGDRVVGLLEWVEGTGRAAPAAFALIYVVAAVAMVPGSVLSLAGGALFGVVAGTALVFASATLAAVIAFCLARYVARPAVERRLRGDRRFERIDRSIADHGFRLVLLLRLTPVVPYNVLNYALGATAVPFRHYLAGSLGMLPGTLLYVYAGRTLGEVAAIAAGVESERGLGGWIVWLLGLLATALLVLHITRLARDTLSGEIESSPTAAEEPNG